MEKVVSGITEAAPEMLKNVRLSVDLSGAPAAVAVGCICGSIVLIYAMYCVEKYQEKKLGVIPSMPRAEPQQLLEDGVEFEAVHG